MEDELQRCGMCQLMKRNGVSRNDVSRNDGTVFICAQCDQVAADLIGATLMVTIRALAVAEGPPVMAGTCV